MIKTVTNNSTRSQLINILETIGVIDWMLFYVWHRTGS